MSDILRIGAYQLRNLIANRVKFLYLDLRDPSPGNQSHALLEGSQVAARDRVLEVVREAAPTNEAPIVLICENGSKCMAAAETLARNSYINVFIVEGGVQGLSERD